MVPLDAPSVEEFASDVVSNEKKFLRASVLDPFSFAVIKSEASYQTSMCQH
jgi:hypothetical protein